MYRSWGYSQKRVTGNTPITSNIICKAATMKPTIQTPSTIILGVHVGSPNSAAIVGSLRTETGSVEQGVVEHVGCTWSALVRALADAATIGVQHVVILSNDAALVTALMKPFPAPTGGEVVKVWNGVRGDGAYVLVDLGNVDHWQVLRALGGQWPGRFAVQLVSDLPKAKALWEASQGNKNDNM